MYIYKFINNIKNEEKKIVYVNMAISKLKSKMFKNKRYKTYMARETFAPI